MGQFDSFSHQTTGADHAQSAQRPAAGGIDFSRIIAEGGAGTAAPAPEAARPAQPVAIYRAPVSEMATTPTASAAPSNRTYNNVDAVSSDNQGDDNPPRPGASDSTSSQLAYWLTNGIAGGSALVAAKVYTSSEQNGVIKKWFDLKTNVNPLTLEEVTAHSNAAVKLIAEKGRAAAAEVEKIALDKPHAFEEKTELMPAKAAGQPPTQLVWKDVRNISNLSEADAKLFAEGKLAGLTEHEGEAVARDAYFRSLERTLVKDFNMADTKTVHAFRSRQPYLTDLGATEAAELEGVAGHLTKLEHSSIKMLEETSSGRIALDKAATANIKEGAMVLGASYVATRAIDRAFYGGRPQGILTTAFDCAAPFMVFAKMSPLAKIGIMVGSHEVVRGIEYLTEKNKQQ